MVLLAAFAVLTFVSRPGPNADLTAAPRAPTSHLNATPDAPSVGSVNQKGVAQGNTSQRKTAHYTALSTLTPITGDAAQVIDSLMPAARSGDMSAALAIFVKANDCRVRTDTAKRNAPNSNPTALVPSDCQSLAPEDYAAAGKWLETAADAGNVDAQSLYSASPEGVLGPPVDWLRHPEEVSKYKRKAMAFMNTQAANGSIDALLDLSNTYEHGVLTDRDPVKAFAYYRAVELSDESAVSQRSLDYLKQNLSPTDVINAEKQARLIHANCCE